MGRAAAAFAVLLLAACGPIPRDPDGTLDQVRERGLIRVGEIAGAPRDPAAEATLAAVAAQTGARVERVAGQGEVLLDALEHGELDLVYGHFAEDSPWAKHVHLGTPPGGPDSPPKSLRLPRFAFKPGENGWIAAVERAAP